MVNIRKRRKTNEYDPSIVCTNLESMLDFQGIARPTTDAGWKQPSSSYAMRSMI